MYRPDPGGNFASDVHRRVAAVVPNPGEDMLGVDELMALVARDDKLKWDVSPEELTEVLSDLEADGDVEQSNGAWALTRAGYEVLTGPNAWVTEGQSKEEAGREYGALQ